MRKTMMCVALCLLCLLGLELQATRMNPSTMYSNDIGTPPGYESIELLGDLLYGVEPGSIVAGVGEHSVYVGFGRDFGNVSVFLYNELGALIYSSVIDTDVQRALFIPLNGSSNGSYTLVLNNASGQAEGYIGER